MGANRMNLQDLTDDCRRILTALFQTSAARQQIADLCQIAVTKVSRDLNRLEGFGFVDKPEKLGGEWCISEAGRRLLGEPVPMIVATALAEPAPQPQEPGPEPEPDSVQEELQPTMAPVTRGDPQQVDPPRGAAPKVFDLSWIAEEQELNVALDEVIARIGSPRIPASALRTYRRLLDHLPPPVQKSLSPITRFLEVQS